MSGHGIHVHGAHDHAVEHEAQKGGLGQQVALFSAILATVGAIVSFFGGDTQNKAMLYKNDAIAARSDASDQWTFYQATSMKRTMAEIAAANATDPKVAEKYRAEAERYKKESEEPMKAAQGFEKKYKELDAKSEHAMHPHHYLSIAMTFLQIAIALASVTVLTQKRWLFSAAALAALIGAVLTGFAYL